MYRDAAIVFIGTFKVGLIIALTLTYSTKNGKFNEMCIPVIGAVSFMWVAWIVTYISQIHPFVAPEIVK